MDKVLSQMKKGDFFLFQFGHNDSKSNWPQSYTEPETSFKAYLGVFIAETRRRGATPVLVTPMERQANADSVGPWARAMREVAKEDNVPLIDQWAMSKELWTTLGANVYQAFGDQTASLPHAGKGIRPVQLDLPVILLRGEAGFDVVHHDARGYDDFPALIQDRGSSTCPGGRGRDHNLQIGRKGGSNGGSADRGDLREDEMACRNLVRAWIATMALSAAIGAASGLRVGGRSSSRRRGNGAKPSARLTAWATSLRNSGTSR